MGIGDILPSQQVIFLLVGPPVDPSSLFLSSGGSTRQKALVNVAGGVMCKNLGQIAVFVLLCVRLS